jgi:hypothetical protein
MVATASARVCVSANAESAPDNAAQASTDLAANPRNAAFICIDDAPQRPVLAACASKERVWSVN